MKRLMILSSLLVLTASVPASQAQETQPYAVPYDQRYQAVRVEPSAPQPLADTVRPKINLAELLALTQKEYYTRSEFAVGRQLIRLSQTGL